MIWWWAILGFTFGMFFGPGWLLYCNNRTYKDRVAVLHASSPTMIGFLAAFHSVSYERHMWLRATFRDPWQAYPQIIRNMAPR